MTHLLQALMVFLPLLYMLVTGLYAMEFGGPRAPEPRKVRQLLTGLLVLAHGAYVGALWLALGQLPASDPLLLPSLLAFSLLIIYLPVEWITATPHTGPFVFMACFGLQLATSAFAPIPPRPSPVLMDAFFAVHVGTGILALAALLLSSFYGGLYLVLLRQMRRHHFGALFSNLPNLDHLARLMRGSATAGFLLLSAGLALALTWAHGHPEIVVNYLDPKILVVLVTWLFFGLIAVSRRLRLLSGRRAAIFAVAGLVLVLLTLVLVSFPLGSLQFFR